MAAAIVAIAWAVGSTGLLVAMKRSIGQ